MVMCCVLQVSRSGYCDWVVRPLSDRARNNERLVVLIRASHTASGGIHGARRVTADLRETGEGRGKNRVARLMRINGIRGVEGYMVPLSVIRSLSCTLTSR
jgi:putative transposase